MTLLTDGRQTIAIAMRIWDGYGYLPDMSPDFFKTESLPKAKDGKTCVVGDVGYSIDQAFDWANYRGDFLDPEAEAYNKGHGFRRSVTVEAA